jgi:hypothetical protein
MKLKHINSQRFFPVNTSELLRNGVFSDLTNEEVRRWGIFKGALTKSPWMREFLLKKQNGTCPICEKGITIEKSQIHHTDYQQLCVYSQCSKLPKPTVKSPNRKIKIAQCHKCSSIDSCVSKIILIHTACHLYLHIKEGRISTKGRSRKDRSDPNQIEFDFT